MTRDFCDTLIETLAEAQRYVLDIADPQVCAEAVFHTLTSTDELMAWADEQAGAAFGRFGELCATGDYAAARDLAQSELLPTLHDAATAGRFDRGSTPAEIRSRDPRAFRSVATVPRNQVRDWLSGRAQAQPTPGVALAAPRSAATMPRARARGAGRPAARSQARSRGGDSGDSDGSGSSEGDGEPPPPDLRLLFLLDPRFGRVNRALARFLRRLEP